LASGLQVGNLPRRQGGFHAIASMALGTVAAWNSSGLRKFARGAAPDVCRPLGAVAASW